MKRELVSIVVLAYNSETTIQETLESCFAQTYPEVEVIVADDASTDDTLSVVRSAAAEHPAIRTVVVENAVNQGIVGNCKSGLAMAKGTWVKILAADDILLPTAIADLVAAGRAAAADVVISQFQSFGAERKLHPRPWTVRGIRSGNLSRAMLMGFGVIAPGVLVKLGTLREESLPSDRYVMAEDTMFYELAKRGYTFTFLERVTARYRVHHEQVSGGQSRGAMLFQADQEQFLRTEVRNQLGAWHPYLLHVRYQRFVDRRCARLPQALRSALKLIDPLLFVQMHVNKDLPWQRARRP